MREAAVRMESKHEETSQSNANVCKALQKQYGILFSKRLQTLLETGGSWSDCRQVSPVYLDDFDTSLRKNRFYNTVTQNSYVLKPRRVLSDKSLNYAKRHTSRLFWYGKWNTTCNQELPSMWRKSFQLEKGWTQCNQKQICREVRKRPRKHAEVALFSLCWN